MSDTNSNTNINNDSNNKSPTPNVLINNISPTTSWWKPVLAPLFVGLITAGAALLGIIMTHKHNHDTNKEIRAFDKIALLATLRAEISSNKLNLKGTYERMKIICEKGNMQMPNKFVPNNLVYKTNIQKLGIIANPTLIQFISEFYLRLDVIQTARLSFNDGSLSTEELVKENQLIYLKNIRSTLKKAIEVIAVINELIGNIPIIENVSISGNDAQLYKEICEYEQNLP